MRRFILFRLLDVNGISGEGIVAEGVEFSSGIVTLRWLNPPCSTAIYQSLEDMYAINGHHGATVIHYLDETSEELDPLSLDQLYRPGWEAGLQSGQGPQGGKYEVPRSECANRRELRN